MYTCMHTRAHVHRGLRSRSAVFFCSSRVRQKALGILLPLPPQRYRLAPRGPAFLLVLGIQLRACALVANAQTTEPPPQPSFEYFDCTKCWVSFQHCCTHIDNMLQSCQHTHQHTLPSLVSQSLLLPPSSSQSLPSTLMRGWLPDSSDKGSHKILQNIY